VVHTAIGRIRDTGFATLVARAPGISLIARGPWFHRIPWKERGEDSTDVLLLIFPFVFWIVV